MDLKRILFSARWGFIILLWFVASVHAGPLPDTGQAKCHDDTGEIPCPQAGEPFYGQDGNYTINPMSYTKLDADGNDLPVDAASWMMVRDNVTGLIWEVKQNHDGIKDYANPHDADNTYTWYDANPAVNGGNPEPPGEGTDTEDFINGLNTARFGGYSGWRMPNRKELRSIVDYSVPYPGPTINTDFFPNTPAASSSSLPDSSDYWSSTTFAKDSGFAWALRFGGSNDSHSRKILEYYVRAVRGKQ